MCIVFIARAQRADFPLIIAANRDEFYARPAQASHFWENHSSVLAGIDLEAGGTWMGVTRNGKIAALTNIRDPKRIKPDAISRGELVADYLCNDTVEARHYIQQLQATRAQYNGYNLVLGDVDTLQVYNNFDNTLYTVEDGIHGLSNATFNTPWPKVIRGMQAITDYCQQADNIVPEALFALMANPQQADDHELPDTGVGADWEKRLSSVFIHTPEYGTRCSTLVLVDKNRQLHWYERTYNNQGVATQNLQFSFPLTTPA